MRAQTPFACFAVLLLARGASADEGVAHPRKLHRFWGGLSFGFNAEVHPSGMDVCLSKTSGWICTTSDYVIGGPLYPDQTVPPRTPFPGQAGRVGGGLAYVGVQVMVGTFDFAVTDGIMLGLRLGVHFHPINVNVPGTTGYPFFGEARATWVFGSHPISEGGVRPYALLGAGLGDFSVAVNTTVVDAAGPHQATAWKAGGPGFITTGIGIRIGWPRAALMIAPLKMTIPFGSGSLATWMPEVSVMSAAF